MHFLLLKEVNILKTTVYCLNNPSNYPLSLKRTSYEDDNGLFQLHEPKCSIEALFLSWKDSSLDKRTSCVRCGKVQDAWHEDVS